MKKLKFILLSLFLLLPLAAKAEDLDMNEYLFGHVGDSYEWHITTVNGHHVTVPLPVIVHSRTSGWHLFSSARLEEGEHEGFYIAPEGEKHAGKIVERQPDGSTVKPLDISVTKNVLGLMINSLVLLVVILTVARWYRRHDAREEVPTGFAGVIEMIITMVQDDIIKECIGKDYRRYSPYLLTAFFFIFVNNLLNRLFNRLFNRSFCRLGYNCISNSIFHWFMKFFKCCNNVFSSKFLAQSFRPCETLLSLHSEFQFILCVGSVNSLYSNPLTITEKRIKIGTVFDEF